ncbi:LacI family transcriptional regulator [Sphingomonas naasensis]|uniref:LacI family transcriptional regulator n=1 Tax=Sphingomonas naasensis TaxID=1344951 RepID=A0A4S1WRN9_9SPHN|nr:LacI family DNA-binding transcriptional regulator [Sphingomonas naasensis]NIJ18831.1 LacI family transcriptional regulator [Sphingomonas naasensis]TGX46058.1 LacI family transcriptional regulator [Sphingomonas naasensis]
MSAHAAVARRATIKDVARRAGVSMMTVSRVLNREAFVADATRATVERAIRDLNYVPNSAAKALALTRHAHRIAFLFDTPNATILGDMVSAVLEEPARPEIRLTFMRVRGDADLGATVEALGNQGVQGVVLSPPLCDDVRLRIVLARAGIRFVAAGCSDVDPGFSAIGIDDRRAAHELTRYLLELGHRRIGLIAGHARHRSSTRRRAGFEEALRIFDMSPDDRLCWQGDYSFGTAIGIAEQALSMEPPLTAIFASNDDMAAAVISVARGRGIAVPRVLSVCGFDDSEIARMMSPQITTVSQPLGAMAAWAVAQLAGELDAVAQGEEPVIRKVLLEHSIAYRGSDAPPPGIDAVPASSSERQTR